MLRIIEQISFSELYMERSTKRSEFFQKIKHLDSLGRDGERNKKNILKNQGIKGQPTYSGISLFKMMLLSNWCDLSNVGTENL
ncbi:MAG: hypothetical protein ACMUEL_05655 [Flavobacteriales bacterium Tduv]